MAYGTMAVYHFCLCNAMKYRWRAGYKDSKEQDLEKALWYQEKSHDYLQKLCHGPNKVFPAIMDFEH